MRLGLRRIAVAVLCWAAGTGAAPEQTDPRLREARAAFDEATKLKDAGKYAKALARGEHALVLREAALGGVHPEVANALNLMGDLYRRRGDYAHAEPLLQRGLETRESALGKSHPDVAHSLSNLAVLYMEQALYGRAEPLYQRALAIREAALGKNNVDVAQSLNDLALLYGKQGMYGSAEPLHQRALAIREAALGKDHPDVAHSLSNLANLYREQGLWGRAEPLSRRALAIREEALGKNHPTTALTLNNLANIYGDQGLQDQEEPLRQRALAISEAALGKNHPDVALMLNNLALFRLGQNRLADTVQLGARAFAIYEQRLRHEALAFSESRLASFLQLLRLDEEGIYMVLRMHPEDAALRSLALSAALLLKGRSAEELANTSRTIYRGLSSEDRGTFERLQALRSQLATLSLRGPGELSAQDYQQRLKELAEQGDALEADLAKRSAALRALTALPSPADIVGRTAGSLPKDAALVELIAYKDRMLGAKPGTSRAERPSQLQYLALVLFADGSTRAVDLGPAAPIDQTASRLRDALAIRDANFLVHSQAFYKLAFQPLRPLLRKTRRVFLSPDGQLSLVPFAVLHDGKSFLVDSFDFSYLTSGRDLLPRSQDIPPSNSVFVLANPDFGASLQAPRSTPDKLSPLAQRFASLERFFSTLRADVAARPWAPLPGTGQEAQAIQRLFPQAQVRVGAEATKEQLLNLPTPGVLHLATHGFFLEDAPMPAGARAVGHFGALNEGVLFQRPTDPLLRSGLVLAGAQAPAPKAPGAAKPSPDAALVTALELAGLNLWGTQLVVLSACDTGRGDVKLGQGVYGLRRALVVAGAETVVMSLWKVNDETTHTLMEAYYQNLLAGQGRASALREAMLALRQSKPHPHYWAPFIALGRDAPLATFVPPQKPPGS